MWSGPLVRGRRSPHTTSFQRCTLDRLSTTYGEKGMLGVSAWRLRPRKKCFRTYAVKCLSKCRLNGAMTLIYHSIWQNGGVDLYIGLLCLIISPLWGLGCFPRAWHMDHFGVWVGVLIPSNFACSLIFILGYAPCICGMGPFSV